MNFEELLETRDARKTTKVRLPYGYFYKRLIDGKYSNFVEFHDEVADHIAFSGSVKAECEALEKLMLKHQLHFTPNEGEDGVYALAVEVGNYVTLGQQLNENPSLVAQGDFLRQTLQDLIDTTVELNAHDIYHLCFAPTNILVRKNDSSVRLLCHGSFYRKIDQDALYDDVEDYVAPEVFITGATVDARADVYSLGKFIAWLYESSGLPIELRRIVDKATQADPEQRYPSVEALDKAIRTARQLRHTAVLGGAAVTIALAIVGLFFYLLPSPDDIEYVKPVDEPIPDDLLEENIDDYLGIGAEADSATLANIVEMQRQRQDSLGADENKMRLYQAKAEAIFRKQFTKAAEAIIDKVYNPEMMSSSETQFAAKNRQMTDELARKQAELAQLTNISSDRSQAIASEIIENLTQKKMETMDKDYIGLKTKPDEEQSSQPGNNKK